MREIIFRGKRADNGEWVYGSLITERNMFDGNLMTMHIQDIEEPYDDNLIDDETVGQFTGLTDKNGIKIFEGDILKGLYANGNAEVKMINGSWVGYAGKGWTDIGYVVDRVEVIGNIHDNFELLNK